MMIVLNKCIHIILLISFIFFFLGIIIQIIFHILPETSISNISYHNSIPYIISPNNYFYFHGNVYNISNKDIENIINDKKALRSSSDIKISNKVDSNNNKAIEPHYNNNNDVSINNNHDIPAIVQAWRNAKLDWHSLLPKHNSLWERFGTPQKEGKLRLLVSKEMMVTNYLTRYHESGLSSMYGHDYGIMKSYSGCNKFQSSCNIHNKNDCILDQFCDWSNSKQLCVQATDPDVINSNNNNNRGCSNPKIITETGFKSITNNNICKVYITSPVVLLSVDSESQSMFYHWWASWGVIMKHWSEQLNQNRNIHYFIKTINDPMFFQYFGLLSDNCWEHLNKEIFNNICLCNTLDVRANQARINNNNNVNHMINYLSLESVQPNSSNVVVGLISRRRKRFILNEYQLVDRVKQLGYDCIVLPLEDMTLYEQVKVLRTLDVLIGIHGSALDNSVFLHPGSVIVQLLPYKVEHRCTFQSSAESAGVIYQEWQLKDPNNAVFHWDLLEQANNNILKKMSKEEYLNRGQQKSGDRETLMFWINQDIIVPLNEWDEIVARAVKSSKASSRGINITPKN